MSGSRGINLRQWPASVRFAALLAVGIAIQVTLLHLMGRVPVCTCGVIRLWQGDVLGPENSQQLTDWYTPSHIVHGLLFSLGLKALFPRLPVLKAFAIALCLEISWELLENSPPMIERYRQQALAQGYNGDSILNSVSDVLACTLGFFIARTIPRNAALALIVAAELFTGYMVRDNLTLNIIQLIHPVPAIEKWQAAGRM